jgi:sensor histidine kinase YesM
VNNLTRYSLRYQVIILFFIIVALPFLFIGYFAYEKSVETIEDVNSVVSLDLLNRTGKNLDAYMHEINENQNDIMFDIQDALSRDPVDRLDEIKLSSELRRQLTLKNNPSSHVFVRIFPWEPSKFPSYANAVYPLVNIEELDWFQYARERGKPFWRLFLPDDNPEVFTEPVIARIKRLYNLDLTTPRGVVSVEIPERVFRDFLSPAMMVEGQKIMLVHTDDSVFFHSEGKDLGRKVPYPELKYLMKGSKSGSETIELDGKKHLVTFTTLNFTNWRLVSMVPLDRLAEPVAGVERITFLFLVFYLVLSLLTIIYITVRFSNPIHKLVTDMRRVERGDFSVQWPQTRRSDEVGLLYHGMSHMVRRLSELIENLGRAAQEKKELEFQVLTHQINPHFLYNTLDAIRWKAEKHNAKDISDMVKSLANLLRLSLNDGNEMTTVARELDHVRAYVNIQEARQDVPIRLVILVDDELLELPVLRLVLQPLVENSIKHGGRYRRGDEIKIVILGSIEEDGMRFEISDNGPGIPPGVRKRLLTAGGVETNGRKGVGLRNVHERLRIYFGEPYGLKIRENSSGGAVIELTHPILPPEKDEEGSPAAGQS